MSRFTLLVLAVALCQIRWCSPAPAETFNIPLRPVIQSGVYGDYLSSGFDFGFGFSHIDSVKVELEMPAGYEGGGSTSGNSSYLHELVSVVHGELPLVSAVWPSGLSSSDPPALAADTGYVAPGAVAEFDFGLVLSFPDEPPTTFLWPDFLLAGHGNISVVDVLLSIYHPLPGGVGGSSSTAWSTPPEIISASLTIVGAAVPEPDSIVTSFALAAIMLGFRRFNTSRTLKSSGQGN